jgi:hypothetical protein
LVGSASGYLEVALFGVEQPPVLAQEVVHAGDAVGVPGLSIRKRSQEHLVHPQRVGAEAGHHVVRVHHVEPTFRHFFYFRTTDVFAVFQDEFGIGII